MKKLIIFFIMITVLVNHNLNSWASEIDNKNSYVLEQRYKNNFLLSSSYDSVYKILDKVKTEEPNLWFLGFSLLFPGIVQIAIGENGWGYTLLTIGLIPVVFMGVVLGLLSMSRTSDPEWSWGPGLMMLFSGIVSITFYGVVYIINLINAITLAITHSQNKLNKSEIKKENNETIDNENFVRNFNEIIKNTNFKNQSIVYKFNF